MSSVFIYILSYKVIADVIYGWTLRLSALQFVFNSEYAFAISPIETALIQNHHELIAIRGQV